MGSASGLSDSNFDRNDTNRSEIRVKSEGLIKRAACGEASPNNFRRGIARFRSQLVSRCINA